MSSYGNILVPKREIWVPKIANLGCFGPKPYLKTPNARKFLDQMTKNWKNDSFD